MNLLTMYTIILPWLQYKNMEVVVAAMFHIGGSLKASLLLQSVDTKTISTRDPVCRTRMMKMMKIDVGEANRSISGAGVLLST